MAFRLVSDTSAKRNSDSGQEAGLGSAHGKQERAEVSVPGAFYSYV